MGIVIQQVGNYAPWIYAICGLVALYQLYRIWAVRAERKQAVFSLEREKAINDTNSILAIALVLLLTMGFTYFMSTTLAAAVEPLVNEALTPTPSLPLLPFLVTPTNTPLPVTPTPTRTPPPLNAGQGITESVPLTDDLATEGDGTPTPVLETPTPTATPAPIVVAPICPDQRALIIRPGENEVVSGELNVIGSATHDSFQYYKIEAAAGANAAGGWQHVGSGQAPVTSGFLTTINTRNLANGVWTLQLVVVDQTGNFIPPCKVTVTVQN